MRKNTAIYIFFVTCVIALTSCGQQNAPSPPDYRETKQMVVDILKTEDGKKAIQEIVQAPDFKDQLMMTDTSITQAVDKALNNPKNQKNITKLFQDPKVAANFARTAQKEHERLMKQLMKDPEYQKLLLDVMKHPEFQNQILDLMKTEPYRKQAMTVMNEALDNPLFKEKYMELLKKATEEAMKSTKGKGGQGQKGGGES